jgi:hypothetical protein
MSKVFFASLISQANSQLKTLSVHVLRAQSNFLTEKSLDTAIQDIKEVQRLLELAKQSYLSNAKPTNTEYLK